MKEGPLVPAPPPATAGKPAWRSWARDARRTLAADGAARAEADRRLLAHLLAWPRWREARWALVYLAFGDECDPLASYALPAGPRFATTRTHAVDLPLTVHVHDPATLERHALGFAHPSAGAPSVPLDDIDVALVPGLVFDHAGGRLGYGQGLYDRLLATLPATVATVGVTRDVLVVPSLPRESHDVDVGWLLTEQGLRRARAR
jgi:5-formyltetrahydrofolate cyclo-ligase